MAVKEKVENKQSRIWQYIKESHKWENYVFVFFAVLVLILGILILTGALTMKGDMPLFGDFFSDNATTIAWILTALGGVFTLYAIYPFYKPSLPELKKISWLKLDKFVGNSVRVLLFITIFALLFFLYDSFITQVLARIIG